MKTIRLGVGRIPEDHVEMLNVTMDRNRRMHVNFGVGVPALMKPGDIENLLKCLNQIFCSKGGEDV